MIEYLKNMSPRKRKQWIHKTTRIMIQITAFVLVPSLFSEAFAGVKSIFTCIGSGQMLIYNSFVRTLVILCAVTILTGRFFCGYLCAFGSLGDWVYALSQWIQKEISKRKVKTVKIPGIPVIWQKRLQWVKYGILAAIVTLCALGVYGSLHGWSPWDVFSMLREGNLRLEGYAVGGLLLILILLGMACKERFFCQFLCPMGALFAILPVLPWTSLSRDRDNCLKGCNICERNCPTGVSLEDDGWRSGECIRCNRCLENCPKNIIRTGVSFWRGSEWWSMILEAALLLGLILL